MSCGKHARVVLFEMDTFHVVNVVDVACLVGTVGVLRVLSMWYMLQVLLSRSTMCWP